MIEQPRVCACVGCPHATNCHCLCAICQSPLEKQRAQEALEYDRREHEALRGVRKVRGAKCA